MRIAVGVASLCALVTTAACSGSPKEQSSSGSTNSGSSSGTTVTTSGVNATSGATSVQSGTSSGSTSSGTTVESGTSSGSISSGTASSGTTSAASGSTTSGTTIVSGTPGVEPPNAGMTNASDVDAARIVAGPSIDCPDGCNTDASYPAMTPVGTPMPIGDQTLPRKLYIENQCTYKTWTFAQPAGTLPGGVPLELDPGQAVVMGWSNSFSGRIWPRTQCTGNGGNLQCEQGNGPDTLAEFTLTAGMASDWYDISLVDGFSLPVGIIQLDAPWGLDPSYVSGGPLPADVQQCGSPVCAVDLNPGCPASQQLKDSQGNIWGCKNGQSANGGHGATPVTTYLKAGCPTSYTYAFDDPQSLFLCKSAEQNGGVGAKDYKVIYCPTQGPVAGFP
jgi:hypothetical protein